MANNRTKRLRPSVLQDDLDAYAALQAIRDYAPVNNGYNLTNGTDAKALMEAKQTDFVQKQAAADAARDDMVSAEWDFHDFILGVKDQVKAQYGKDSNEVQSLGLKKKSEYRTPTRRGAPVGDGSTP